MRLALTEDGFETIMVNCNPETVSTDYDTSDRLYFEPLTLEDVFKIVAREKPEGVIVQFGGQTPLNLAIALEKAGIRFSGPLPIRSIWPRTASASRPCCTPSPAAAGGQDPTLGGGDGGGDARRLPPVLRPSYVLGGRAMEPRPRRRAAWPLYGGCGAMSRQPGLVSTELSRRHRGRCRCHLGWPSTSTSPASWSISRRPGSTPATPPAPSRRRFAAAYRRRVGRQTRPMALALGVVGLMNVQFAMQANDIYVLEVNPRACRTVPFVAKATDIAIATIAARVMAGEPLSAFPHRDPSPQGHRPRRPPPLRRPLDAGRPRHALVLRQGGRDAFQPLPRRRHAPRPRDALDRRGDGLGPQLPPRLPQGADGRRHSPPHRRHPLRLGQGGRQNASPLLEASRILHSFGFRILATDGTPSASWRRTPSPPPASTRSTRAAPTSSTP